MGSPLGPTLANIFLCYCKTTGLKNCPKSFKPVYYKRYVDEIFVLFEKLEEVLQIVNYMNKRHKSIKFSFETEKDNFFFLLDVNIYREKDKFRTTVFRKDTFSGVYTNFSSFVALEHKFGFVHTFTKKFHNCLIFPNFILKLKHLRKHFTNMLIPQNLLTSI